MPADDTQPQPPNARQMPVNLVAHGDVREDPYHWLRGRDDPEVIAYLEAENAYTEAMTAHTRDLQETLYREILGRIKETDVSAPEPDGEWLYYSRTEAGLAYPIHCRRRRVGDGPEEVLLDVNAKAAGHDYCAAPVIAVSPDHSILAFTLDTRGDEVYTLRFKDLATGDLLADTIEDVDYSVVWANDSQTVFYTVTDAAHRPYKLYRHRLGTPVVNDTLVLTEDDERFRLRARRSRSRRFVLVESRSAQTGECHVLDADRPKDPPRLIQPREERLEYSVDHQGDRFLIVTNADGATNFKLLEAPLATPGRDHWREVIPHRPEVMLEGIEPFAGHLVILEREAGLPRFEVRDLATGAAHRVQLPEPAYTAWPVGNREWDCTTFRFEYTSLTTPLTIFDHDMVTRQRTVVKETEVPGYDRSRYVTERLAATMPDGMDVPISLVHRRDVASDGPRPLLLYAYGAYGYPSDPSFSPARVSLLDRGFTFVIAHVRGGGDLGRPWYDDGKLLYKKHTFTDFLGCAEHLVHHGYTSPERLAILGGSAGGLLIGAVVNLLPGLFRCAIAKVPFVDVVTTMLDPTIPLTVGEYEEWGNPNAAEAYYYMKSYSPYDNVVARDYPAMLVTAGLHDPQVQYWEPAKWVAKLRATKTDGHRLLLKTQMGAGHRGPSGRYAALREAAFEFAFLLDEMTV